MQFVLIVLIGALGAAGCASSHDPDTGPDVASCTRVSECVLVPRTCCGDCGEPRRGDALALHRDHVEANRREACAGIAGCPPCIASPDPTLRATCEASRCEVVDLQALPLTECSRAEECRIRTKDCCECGGETSRGSLIAIRADREADYARLACDEGAATACPRCAPAYPGEAMAGCVEGRCVVLWSDP
ncbi:MAG: hypothetical protein NZ898_04680 [Myxococcota bacterium]|nr:hypothetical protein [Myxococcota bacterium]MDW8361525.1 hypothetical protein [Myxococcales bacterium]